MRIRYLSLAVLLVVAFCALAAARPSQPRSTSTSTVFTPPPEPGLIYVVIDFPRSGGNAQPATVSVAWGDTRVSGLVSPHYSCRPVTPSGAVIRIRHRTDDQTPLTFSTTGTIVRAPYQGDPPAEQLYNCYRLVKFM
jgi:hypothetical protein